MLRFLLASIMFCCCMIPLLLRSIMFGRLLFLLCRSIGCVPLDIPLSESDMDCMPIRARIPPLLLFIFMLCILLPRGDPLSDRDIREGISCERPCCCIVGPLPILLLPWPGIPLSDLDIPPTTCCCCCMPPLRPPNSTRLLLLKGGTLFGECAIGCEG